MTSSWIYFPFFRLPFFLPAPPPFQHVYHLIPLPFVPVSHPSFISSISSSSSSSSFPGVCCAACTAHRPECTYWAFKTDEWTRTHSKRNCFLHAGYAWSLEPTPKANRISGRMVSDLNSEERYHEAFEYAKSRDLKELAKLLLERHAVARYPQKQRDGWITYSEGGEEGSDTRETRDTAEETALVWDDFADDPNYEARSCPGECSGHGFCNDATCNCMRGYAGSDCRDVENEEGSVTIYGDEEELDRIEKKGGEGGVISGETETSADLEERLAKTATAKYEPTKPKGGQWGQSAEDWLVEMKHAKEELIGELGVMQEIFRSALYLPPLTPHPHLSLSRSLSLFLSLSLSLSLDRKSVV